MKATLRTAAALAIGLTLIPPYMYYLGHLGLAEMKGWMLTGTALWFVAAVPLANRRDRTGKPG